MKVLSSVHAGDEARKIDSYRLQAFDSNPAGPVALVEEDAVLPLRLWPQGQALGVPCCERPLPDWPRVGWLTSHAGFDAALVDAAVAAGFHGLVLAGTGNGTLHADLEATAARAAAAGVVLRLCARCASGRVVGQMQRSVPVGATHSAAHARVALLLELLVR